MTHLARIWWTVALRGLLAILFGALAIAWPGITVAVFVLLFGAYALVDGVFALVLALAGGVPNRETWGLLLEGLVGIGIGAATFAWPGITLLALVILIAVWAILLGVLALTAAGRLRHQIEGEWWVVLGGVVSVLFGVLLLVAPLAGALALAQIVGAYSVLSGVFLIVLAFRLRRWQAEGWAGRAGPGRGMTT